MEFKEVTNGERARTYHYPNGDKCTIANVARVAVSPSGSGGHRIETVSGTKFIVRGGWLMIEVDADSWSF